MARPRLTKAAIAFIIECRDDPHRIFTWQDIANLVEEEFGISVSLQAIANNYRKYKEDPYIAKISKTNGNKQNVFRSAKPKKDLLKSFDKKTDDIDLNDLFKPAEE